MYGKIFASLWDGTLATDWPAWSTLVYMIATCDPDGVVDATHEAISARSGIPLEVVRQAIALLESPDPRSRNPAEEGRRLVRLDDHRDWGWRLVNYEHYRNLIDAETRREQMRKASRRYRSKRHPASSGVIKNHQASSQAEVEAEALESNTCRNPVDFVSGVSVLPDRNMTNGTAPVKARRSSVEREPEGFLGFYEAGPRRDARRAAAKAFAAALERHPEYTADDLIAAAKLFAEQCRREHRDPRFIPLPATWLNQDRFREFFDEEEPPA